jgi:UDP-3-O-[3-hydroxymyristoyl] N-acetylglucosamine deacetylase
MQSSILTRAVGPFQGVGLFTGTQATLRFVPAPMGSGLRVRRLSFDQVATRDALVEHVIVDHTSWAGKAAVLMRNTTLSVSREPDGASARDASSVVATIEHAMAALAGLHVWDATIEIEGMECPILDGSCADFVRELLPATETTQTTRRPVAISRRVEVRDDRSGAVMVAEPVADVADASLTYELDYGGRGGIGTQRATWNCDAEAFAKNIAPARTFALAGEIAQARAFGQFAWLSPQEILVFDDAPGKSGPIENSLRFADEPARHKLLDLIGDLALLGAPLQAKVVASKSGHALTHALCRTILAAQ